MKNPFADLKGRLGKLKATADMLNRSLDQKTVRGATTDGRVRIEGTGRGRIKTIEIDASMKGPFEDHVLEAYRAMIEEARELQPASHVDAGGVGPMARLRQTVMGIYVKLDAQRVDGASDDGSVLAIGTGRGLLVDLRIAETPEAAGITAMENAIQAAIAAMEAKARTLQAAMTKHETGGCLPPGLEFPMLERIREA